MIYKTNSGYGVNFNQLAGIATPKTINGITCTHLSDGGYRFTGTANSNGAIFTWNTIDNVIPIPTHKYYIKFLVTDYEEDSLLPRFTANGIGALNSPYEGIITARENANQTCYSYWNANTRSDCTVYVIQRDLTVMFGSGNEPTTVAEFREMYSDDYYGYTLSQWQWAKKGKITSYPTPCFGVDFNQKFNSASPNISTRSGVSCTRNNNVFTFSGTATAEAIFSLVYAPPIGHKILYSPTIIRTKNLPNWAISQNYLGNIGEPLIRVANRGSCTLYAYFVAGWITDGLSFSLNIFDLTQMYGEGNEPATVEEFRSKFPDTYYPYTLSEMRYIDEKTSYTLLPIEHHIVGLAKRKNGETDFDGVQGYRYGYSLSLTKINSLPLNIPITIEIQYSSGKGLNWQFGFRPWYESIPKFDNSPLIPIPRSEYTESTYTTTYTLTEHCKAFILYLGGADTDQPDDVYFNYVKMTYYDGATLIYNYKKPELSDISLLKLKTGSYKNTNNQGPYVEVKEGNEIVINTPSTDALYGQTYLTMTNTVVLKAGHTYYTFLDGERRAGDWNSVLIDYTGSQRIEMNFTHVKEGSTAEIRTYTPDSDKTITNVRVYLASTSTHYDNYSVKLIITENRQYLIDKGIISQ